MPNRPSLRRWLLVASAICLLSTPGAAWAHRDDYLDETLVYLTLEHSELEPEYWLDYGRRPDAAEPGATEHFFAHNLALEYGISDRWMVDGRATVDSPEGGATELESGRLETRLRFGEEGSRPVDVAISGEMNWERDEDGTASLGIEPRLVLSKDLLDRLNLTLNLSEEVPLDEHDPSLHVDYGVRFDWTDLVRVGSEVKVDLDRHLSAVIPQIWFTPLPDVTVKAGWSVGFDRDEERFVRIAVEIEI